MYSQNELDEAVAAGAISADAATALRSYIEGQRSLPTPDEEQFRLITGFNDIFVSIAAAILLFAVGFIGQWIGQRTGSRHRRRRARRSSRRCSSRRPAWGLALFFTAKRRMALPSILLLLAFVGSVFATVGLALVLGVGPNALDNNPQLGGMLGRGFGRHRGGCRLASLEAVPRSDHRRRRGSLGRRPSSSALRRCGAGRAGRKCARTSSSASSCCSASARSCSPCGGTAPTAHASRAARTSPSGSTCSRRR